MSIDVLIVISLLVGTVVAEIAIRAIGGTWFLSQLRKIIMLLQMFQVADGDDERQALLFRSGRATLQFGLVMLALIVVLATIFGLALWALEWNESQQIIYLVVVSAVATGWWFLRCAQNSASTTVGSHAYSILDRWLHWLALEPAAVRRLAFDLERQFALRMRNTQATSILNQTVGPADGAVYICGLARSGTTMLLHILGEIDTFRSLTYRDMPFVLSPNLWRKITSHFQRQSVPVQRTHGDNILVHFDSPECFEEVFWRTFCTTTSNPHCLDAGEPTSEVLTAFADYRSLVANPRTKSVPANDLRRYLSKNNNNLLRLRSLCADQTATVLLVYRNPMATARSLHRQHQRFCAAQTEDRFTRTYMSWLAHHEFGLDHLPFCFAVPEMDTLRTPDDLNYWLAYWNAVYKHVLAQSDLCRLYLVNHDELCAEPAGTLKAIFAVLGVQADAAALAQLIVAPETEVSDGFCTELLCRAETTYRALLGCSKNLSTSRVKPE